MPVACASAPRGGAEPANAATSTATARRMLVSLPRFRGRRETGTHPAGHSFPFPKSDAARPPSGRAAEELNGSEADAAGQDEGLAAPEFSASLREIGRASCRDRV